MTKVNFNELAKATGNSFGPLKRICLSIMFFIAPGSTLVIVAKTFLQLTEDFDDDVIKEMIESIKNA
jgi:hypothetical protein